MLVKNLNLLIESDAAFYFDLARPFGGGDVSGATPGGTYTVHTCTEARDVIERLVAVSDKEYISEEDLPLAAQLVVQPVRPAPDAWRAPDRRRASRPAASRDWLRP